MGVSTLNNVSSDVWAMIIENLDVIDNSLRTGSAVPAVRAATSQPEAPDATNGGQPDNARP